MLKRDHKMKSYTVKEISELLETNPETVRRWIRDGRLVADQTSKKEGNVISEAALGAFLDQTPKYATKALENIPQSETMKPMVMAVSFMTGLSIGAAGVILTKWLLGKKKEKETDAISHENLARCVRECIADLEKSIAQKKEDLSRVTAALNAEEKELENYKAVLRRITGQD